MGTASGLNEDAQTIRRLNALCLALDSLNALIFSIDYDGRYTFASPRFCEFVGLPLLNVLGRRSDDFFDVDAAAEFNASTREAMQSSKIVETKGSLSPRNGKPARRFTIVKVPIHNLNGDIEGVSGIAIDLTDREQTKALLSNSQALLNTLLCNVEGHIYMKGPDRRYLYANPKVVELFQKSAEQIVGHTDAELLSQEEALQFKVLDDKVFSTGERHAAEECFPGEDGRLQHFWSIKLLLKDAERPGCLVGISYDITELKEAEKAMASSEARFRALFEGSSEALFVLSDSKVMDCNQAAAELLGLSKPSNCLTLSPSELFSSLGYETDIEGNAKALHRADVSRADSNKFESTLKRLSDGVKIPVEVSFSVIELEGEPVRLATVRDLTERKVYEERISHLAFYDALTDLPNRRLFFDRLEKSLAESKRHGTYGAVVYLDLDNFKPLNDSHGHRAGDLLLQEVARRLAKCVREEDTVARLGGDEFAILLVRLAASKEDALHLAQSIAERILRDLGENYLLTVEEGGEAIKHVEHQCSASLGVTLFPPCEVDGEAILRRADNAMYQAKEEGRNRIRINNTEQ